MDVVSPYAPLDEYKLVVAPNLNLIPESLAKHLLDYVKNGGHLVLGPRAGLKDEYDALLPQRQPGFLADALGARVEQFYALEKNVPLYGTIGTGAGSLWAEQLKTTDANTEVWLRYGTSNGWLDGQPAVVTHAVEKGTITYVGAVLDDTLVTNLAEQMVRQSGVKPVFGAVPDGVEVSRRVGANKQVFVFINFSQQPKTIVLPRTMKSLLEDKPAETFELEPYGVGLALDHR
jgi:beta-galactosidase